MLGQVVRGDPDVFQRPGVADRRPAQRNRGVFQADVLEPGVVGGGRHRPHGQLRVVGAGDQPFQPMVDIGVREPQLRHPPLHTAQLLAERAPLRPGVFDRHFQRGEAERPRVGQRLLDRLKRGHAKASHGKVRISLERRAEP
jgi:hypothetical protein